MLKYILSALFIVLLLLQGLFIDTISQRVSKLESDRWVCAQTARQRVLIIDPVSGATQALMDTCVEWKAK